MFKVLLLVCGAVGAFCGAAQGSDFQIRFQTAGTEGQVEPDGKTVKVTFDLHREGEPVDALLHITLDSPPPGSLLSTDFPIVEGTRLIDSRVSTHGGRFSLEYMFPIRGQYRWEVTAVPLDARHLRQRQAFDFYVGEDRDELFNFAILLTVLASLGLLAGIVLARDALRKAAFDGLAGTRWALLVVIFVGLPGAQAAAHGPGGHAKPIEIRDHIVVTREGQRLSLRMVPQKVLGSATAEAAAEHQRRGEEVYQARVGDLAFLLAESTVDGAPVPNIIYTLALEHVEEDKRVFSTTASAPNGVMQWGQQFFDGAPHRVSVTAAAQDGSFAPLTAQMVVGVEAVQPPGHIVARTLTLLLALTAVAMFAGYLGGLYFGRGRAPARALRRGGASA